MNPSFDPVRLVPILASDFWLIGPAPVLPEFLQPNIENPPECVDHHLFQGFDGAWHLWGCIRGVRTGRILYHWEGESLERGPWRSTGEIIRPDSGAGESLTDWEGQEWIQSPFIIKNGSRYYFFYGGHSTGLDQHGRNVPAGDPNVECQICLMTSLEGRIWERYHNERGQSRLFASPGEARDPCVVRIEGLWYLYYAGYKRGDPMRPGIYLRTSTDLIHWSDSKLVHRALQFTPGRWSHECPHVVKRGGYYYLFRTEDYDRARTHVFRSSDPADFGIDQAAEEKYIGLLPLAAPEIIMDRTGNEYITSCHDLVHGIQICRLAWTEE